MSSIILYPGDLILAETLQGLIMKKVNDRIFGCRNDRPINRQIRRRVEDVIHAIDCSPIIRRLSIEQFIDSDPHFPF